MLYISMQISYLPFKVLVSSLIKIGANPKVKFTTYPLSSDSIVLKILKTSDNLQFMNYKSVK